MRVNLDNKNAIKNISSISRTLWLNAEYRGVSCSISISKIDNGNDFVANVSAKLHNSPGRSLSINSTLGKANSSSDDDKLYNSLIEFVDTSVVRLFDIYSDKKYDGLFKITSLLGIIDICNTNGSLNSLEIKTIDYNSMDRLLKAVSSVKCMVEYMSSSESNLRELLMYTTVKLDGEIYHMFKCGNRRSVVYNSSYEKVDLASPVILEIYCKVKLTKSSII